MGATLRVVILEDRPPDAELMVDALRQDGLKPEWKRVDCKHDFLKALEEKPDIVLADYNVPGFGAVDALEALHKNGIDVPVIIVSGAIGDEFAAECIRLGADDFLLKDRLARLGAAVTQALERKRAAEQLRESEIRFRQLTENIRDVFWIISAETGEGIYISPAYEQIWGRTRQSLYENPKGWLDAIHPEDRNRVQESLDISTESIAAFDVEYRISRPDGSIRWIHDRGFPVPSNESRVYRIVGIAEDITERKKQEQKIARLNRIYSVMSGINSAIVRIRGRQQLFEEACRIAVEHGKFRMAWIGLLEPDSMSIRPMAWKGLESEELSMLRLARNDVPEEWGTSGTALRGGKPVFCNDLSANLDIGVGRREAVQLGYRSLVSLPLIVGDAAIGVMVLYAKEPNFFDEEEMKLLEELAGDISFALEYIEKEEKVNYLAYYDVLTSLPNQALCQDRTDQCINAASRDLGKKVVLVLIDIERFHILNVTLGRDGGDKLLKQVAERLKTVAAGAENLARFSAHCFAMVFGGVREAAGVARNIEGKLIAAFNKPFNIQGHELRISIKAGLAVYPGDGTDADALFRNAEAALQKAKTSSERYLFYAPEMNAREAEKLTLENKLRKALEAQQFVLHYQPKLDAKSGHITGLEALIRWNDPETGLVPPYKFIPILEETGLILEVGNWVIQQALSDFRQWAEKGLKVPRIAVNVSPIQLQRKDFVDIIQRVIEEWGTAAQNLDLEITESLIMDDIEGNILKLKSVRDLGIGIAIDDFGTGYSSLGYLAKLPVNTLKIDRSFVVAMNEDADGMAIVSTMISLAHSLKLKVVAEGVETEEQSKLLRLFNCDEMQGYLFSKPMPQEKVADYLLQNLGATFASH